MNFWQPATDMMTGLMFVLLLIIMLLMLYILTLPKKKEDYSKRADHNYESYTRDYTESTRSTHHENETNGEGGKQEEKTTEEKIPTSGGGKDDEGMKAAVYAVMIDAETKKTIEKKDVAFELYEKNKSLQTLYTYYPEKIGYKKFLTTEKGDFYLPEKVWEGNYYFRQLTDVDGYNKADDTDFSIDKLYDWPDPYVVKIPMYPASSIIYVNMQDEINGESVPEGEFQIIAAEDIITKDGSIRFKAGKKVGKIKINEKGEGHSKKLYLGKYKLVQSKIPQKYAGLKNDIVVNVEKEMKKENPTTIKNSKTTLSVLLTDELYPEQTLSDISFTLKDETGNSLPFTTDQDGHFEASELNKDTTYTLTQETLPEGYLSKISDYTFSVDKKGHIENNPTKNAVFTNRKIRASFEIKDKILGSYLTNETVHLKKDEKTIETWTNQGTSVDFESLEPGNYVIETKNNTFPIIIKDKAENQKYTIKVFTIKSILVVFFCFCLLLAIIGGIVKLILVIRKRRKE